MPATTSRFKPSAAASENINPQDRASRANKGIAAVSTSKVVKNQTTARDKVTKTKPPPHPSWRVIILECIAGHPSGKRLGVSRKAIKTYAMEKYELPETAANATYLSRAIEAGVANNIFVRPATPSGKIKASKGKTPEKAKTKTKMAPTAPIATVSKLADVKPGSSRKSRTAKTSATITPGSKMDVDTAEYEEDNSVALSSRETLPPRLQRILDNYLPVSSEALLADALPAEVPAAKLVAAKEVDPVLPPRLRRILDNYRLVPSEALPAEVPAAKSVAAKRVNSTGTKKTTSTRGAAKKAVTASSNGRYRTRSRAALEPLT